MKKSILKFIPRQYKTDEENYRKARLFIYTCFITSFFSFFYFLTSSYFKMPYVRLAMIFNFSSFLLLPFLFRKNIISLWLAANLYVLVGTIGVGIVVYNTGGLKSSILPWFAVLPITSLMMGDKKSGWFWTGISYSTMSLVGILSIYNFSFKDETTPAMLAVFNTTNLTGLVLLIFVIATVFENTKNEALKKVEERTDEIAKQRNLILIKQKEILDSITYAKKIQEAILPSDKQMHDLLPDSFVLYKPKDIVSGDFYWATQWGNKILFAAVDCTGHGVPGAFMSIVSQNLLNQAVNEYGLVKPNLILNDMNRGIAKTLNQNKEVEVKDGMDIALCALDMKEMTLEFAGAYSPLWILRDNEIIEIKGNKFPVGLFIDNKLQYFENKEIKLQKNDIIYIFTDGYADQFGGPSGKKFKNNEVKKLVLQIGNKPLQHQKEILNQTIETWKGEKEDQLDDILFIGIKV